jgi:shikimate dehydrogenase
MASLLQIQTDSGHINGVNFLVSPKTKYILSTSGRISSLQRYKRLLQDLLQVDVAYLPFHTGSSEDPIIDPQRFVYALKGLPCIGGAISKDIKHGIVKYLDELDETAAAVQSVNTVIVQDGGRLVGYNTDVLGFRYAIEEGIKKSNISVKTAVCFGYGGVASVVVSVLQSLGIQVFLAGRNLSSAEERAQQLNCSVWGPSVDIDLFVNATPASESPLDQAANFLESLKTAKIVFDHEMPGKYLQEYVQAHNLFYIPGTAMYYPQMEIQWGLFLDGLVDPKQIPALIKKANESV